MLNNKSGKSSSAKSSFENFFFFCFFLSKIKMSTISKWFYQKIKTYKKIKLLLLVLVLQEFSCVFMGQNLSMDSLLNISFCSLFSTPIKSSKYFSTANSSKNYLGSKKASFSLYFLKIILTFGKFGLHFFLMFISSFHTTCRYHQKQRLFGS